MNFFLLLLSPGLQAYRPEFALPNSYIIRLPGNVVSPCRVPFPGDRAHDRPRIVSLRLSLCRLAEGVRECKPSCPVFRSYSLSGRPKTRSSAHRTTPSHRLDRYHTTDDDAAPAISLNDNAHSPVKVRHIWSCNLHASRSKVKKFTSVLTERVCFFVACIIC